MMMIAHHFSCMHTIANYLHDDKIAITTAMYPISQVLPARACAIRDHAIQWVKVVICDLARSDITHVHMTSAHARALRPAPAVPF
jgi:hypothetical protein